MIGHNRGPPLSDVYRTFLWKKAKREAKKVPIEIVRFRIKEAKKEGLSYQEYCDKYRLHRELSSI